VTQTNRCGCGASWTGANVSHCGECHQTFTGVSSFDDHRAGKKPHNGKGFYRPSGHCYDPKDTGQSQNAKGNWGFPDKEKDVEE
jgi:ribosomal protein L34E